MKMAAPACRKGCRLSALLLAFVGIATAEMRSEASVTPITKVIQMLNDMISKGRAEMQTEETKFSKFSQWCRDTSTVKRGEIKNAGERIEMLQATIQEAVARIRSLTGSIDELNAQINGWSNDQKSAQAVRDKEETDYQATATDYTESIEALDGAITVLKRQSADRPQTEAALLQVRKLRLLPSTSKRALTLFLQQADSEVELQPEEVLYKAPEAHGYEFQSGGVVDMLEKLKDEFQTKKYELDKEEMNSKHNFEMLMQQLYDNIEDAKHEISKKTTSRSESEQTKAESEGELAQTQADMAEDQKYLDDTVQLCVSKAQDFSNRKKLRGEEIEAIQKALEIISSDAVKGSGEKYLPTLLQLGSKSSGRSLAQLRKSSSGSKQDPLQDRVAAFLSDRAQYCNSRLLLLISQRVASDPFDKVKKMIKDLISKLMEESTAEIEHKGWCDTELTTNAQTRGYKSSEVDKLKSEVEGLTSEIAQLGQDIAQLSADIQGLQSSMAQMASDRADAKATNQETIKEAKDGAMAVEQAIAVLKEFYAKSADATSLTQQTPGEDAPETFSKPYRGMLPEGGNVVDFLEVILQDFSRLEAETSTAENTEAEEYEKYKFEAEKDLALKQNEMGHKEAKKTDKESTLHSTEVELKTSQEALEKAMEYYEKLKPTCVDSGVSYEDRVKRREEEIQSLQEAVKILGGDDIA